SFSFSDPYIRAFNEEQSTFSMPFDFFLSNNLTNNNSYDPSLNFNRLTEESMQIIQEQVNTQEQQDDKECDYDLTNNSYDPSLGNNVNFNRLTKESVQIIQEQVNTQEVTYEQQSDKKYEYDDEEFEHDNERNDNVIKVGAPFTSWECLENALKRYESEVRFKAIKFQLERDSNGAIIRRYFVCENSKEHQPKKKTDSMDHRERKSKKVGCPWQLNARYRKNDEFAPSLRSFSQEVLDDIKFLTQECGLGANAQRRYISKKFPEQPLYDHDLYNAICKYKNQLGYKRENDAAEMFKYRNNRSEAELIHRWEELLVKYPASESYLKQLWKSRYSWAKIYVCTTFCAGMQSTQRVEGINRHIKTEVNAKTSLLNLGKAIQIRLECESQYQRLSEYKNSLPIKGLPSFQSVFFEPIQDIIKKYLTLKSSSVQNEQISQSILYCACLFEPSKELTMLPSAHECTDGYLEDEYDALQASLENIMNIVNYKHILEIWKVLLFDHHDHSSDATELDMNEEINQVVSIRGSNTYQATIHASITEKQEYAHGFGIAKSGLKFAMENGLVNEFVGLIVKFIENNSEVNTNKRMTVDINQIENPKKSKHKGHPKLQNSTQQDIPKDINPKQDLNKRQDLDSEQDLNSNRYKLRKRAETDSENENCVSSGTKENSASKIEACHCGNCYGTGHYATT
ncbi:8897_t:CDS:2, partial [Dentiscutata erythropus]